MAFVALQLTVKLSFEHDQHLCSNRESSTRPMA